MLGGCLSFIDFLGLGFGKEEVFLLVCLVMCLHSRDWCYVAGGAVPAGTRMSCQGE